MSKNSVKSSKKPLADNSTQRSLAFSSIRDNIVLMKDWSARIILKCSSINFLLKSSEEQDAIIVSFQRFLNTLKFPIQILIRSKKLDIDSYLQKLEEKALKQENTLLQNQTYEYIWYLKKLIEVAQIMKKEFYIIVPYDNLDNTSVRDNTMFWPVKSFWNSIFNSWVDIATIKAWLRNFSNTKKELSSRSNSIKTWIENMWVKAEELSKSELVSFLIDYYNPRLDNFTEMKTWIDNYDLIK